MNRLLATTLIALLAVSCRKHDTRTMVIHVPEMKNEACVEIVLRAIHATSGVHRDRTRVDRETRTVSVAYNSIQLSTKNIEFAVADAGFAANTIPANKKAATGSGVKP